MNIINASLKNTKAVLFFSLFSLALSAQQTYNTAKPWAYWWWLGSAVNKADLAQNIKSYADAGFGGLHIIPIYGVKGEEANFIPYLSPEWLEMLDFTVNEAQKHGLGIDMSLGTGWPYGGKQVTDADAAQKFRLSITGETLQLTSEPTKQKVKRAAPGAEGWVIDHFSKQAVENYLAVFDSVFTAKNYGVRAFYNDSYEVYEANWTPHFFAFFQEKRGYNLEEHLDVLKAETAPSERAKRVLHDYHLTIHELLLENFTKQWTTFATKHRKLSRNEAHGSPANILDLYAMASIPETEFFGSKPFAIKGYRQDPDYDPSRFGVPTETVMKLASSPAHIMGKPLVSSETATWLGNHFKVTLAQIKPIVDEAFVAGVNHVFYHGIPYSPPNEPFPGWLFYASTNFNQNSHFWKELPLLNRYVEKCQSKLQQTKPDNDLLVYLPFPDLWHSVGNSSKLNMVDVHNITKSGIFTKDLLTLLDSLKYKGISYDFVSDTQLQQLTVTSQKQLQTEGKTNYKALLLPEMEYIPEATMRHIGQLAKQKAIVVFDKNLPKKVAGYANWESRQAAFETQKKKLNNLNSQQPVKTLLEKGIIGETFSQQGLAYIRKKTAKNQLMYFIANVSANTVNSLTLSTKKDRQWLLTNPLTNKKEYLVATNGNLPVTLASGESIFIEEISTIPTDLPQWKQPSLNKEMLLITTWNINFTDGIPSLPDSYQIEKLDSWTNAPDTSARYFNGYAEYTTTFELTDIPTHSVQIDLGDVRETAEVSINEQSVGMAWCLPYRLEVPSNYLRKQNTLCIKVRNTSANYVRLLDAQKVNWKKFYDINFVDITYTPFDATRWPIQPSGLLGPVRIMY